MSSMQKVAMRKRTIPAVLSTLAVLGAVLGVAACGSSGGGKEVTLVAYSTPQGAYTSLIPAFNATSEGKGITFSQSYGPSGEQSRAVAAGLKADVVNFSLEPDVTRLVKAGLVSARLEQERHPRLRHQLGGRDHRAQGQPQAHHRLERPGQAGHPSGHPQPLHLRQRALEHPRRLRRPDQGRQDARRSAGLSTEPVPQSGQPGQLGAQCPADIPRRPRRRPDRLRGRGDHRPEEGLTDRIRDPQGHDPDPEPDRRRQRRQHRRGAEVRQLPALARRPEDLG